MKKIPLWAILLVALVAWMPLVHAQTVERPNHIQTPQAPNGPYGTQWAKPPGATGGQIYNDPRFRDPNGPYKLQRNRTCPAPTLYDPASGRCQ